VNPQQTVKYVAINADCTEDNTSYTTTPVDCAGFDYAVIVCHFGNVPANVAALKVQECDTVGGSYADIAGTIVGTATDIEGNATALPAGTGGDNAIVVFEIDLRGRKRFLDLVCTAGNGSATPTEMSAVAILSRGKNTPITVAERGAADILRV
jgi:hypothetical protein